MTPLETGLNLTLLGVGTTFVVLAALAYVVYLIGRLDKRLAAAEERRLAAAASSEPAAAGAPSAALAPAGPGDLDPTTVVLIPAAVAAVTQGRFAIRRIHRIGGPGANAWQQQGRASIQGSHAVQQKR